MKKHTHQVLYGPEVPNYALLNAALTEKSAVAGQDKKTSSGKSTPKPRKSPRHDQTSSPS